MSNSYRVLVVEDDTDTFTLLQMVLRGMPLEISHASTGRAALEFLGAQHPDLVMIDLNLPDMRGWEVVERIKGDAANQHTPIIVLTSHAEPINRLIGTLQPIAAYLNKPVQGEVVRQTIRAALSLA